MLYAKIAVSWNPSPSSARRIAPTRPSIMSEGATASAPARAWERATRASRGRSRRCRRCRRGRRRRRRARCTGRGRRRSRSGSRAPRRAWPGSRSARAPRRPRPTSPARPAVGEPEQQYAADAEALRVGGDRRRDVGRDVTLAGQRRDGPVDVGAADDESGWIRSGARRASRARGGAGPGTAAGGDANSGEAHDGSVDAVRAHGCCAEVAPPARRPRCRERGLLPAAARSAIQTTSPACGATCALGSGSPARMRSRASRLRSPSARISTRRERASAGSVSVRRSWARRARGRRRTAARAPRAAASPGRARRSARPPIESSVTSSASGSSAA